MGHWESLFAGMAEGHMRDQDKRLDVLKSEIERLTKLLQDGNRPGQNRASTSPAREGNSSGGLPPVPPPGAPAETVFQNATKRVSLNYKGELVEWTKVGEMRIDGELRPVWGGDAPTIDAERLQDLIEDRPSRSGWEHRAT